MEGAISLIDKNVKSRVSSVLNRRVKEFGKEKMFDGSSETCWNSDQGSPQYVALEFATNVKLKELRIMFQGGFVGQEFKLMVADGSEAKMTEIMTFEANDDNTLQSFPIAWEGTTHRIQIIFTKSTDFYGRITIYKLDVLGQQAV
jgi:hypothetical protein